MEIRSRFDQKRIPVTLSCKAPGRTKSEFRESCDINYILDKYQKTSSLPTMKKEALYGDFATAPQYQESLNIILEAENQFQALDAKVRKRFHNDPAEFLEFTADPENSKEMIKLGLQIAPEIIPEIISTPPSEHEENPDK